MMFRKPLRTTRAPLALALALCGLFAFVSSAAAVVYVYKNGFGSKSAYKEIKPLGSEDRCDRSYAKGSKAMRIDVRGLTFCEYSPPVSGDANQPDHEIVAEGRILDATSDAAKKRAYLAVRVRVGDGTFYEFRVQPKGKEYSLDRVPAGGGSGLPLTGTDGAINPIGEKNKLRLRITGGDVSAFVNGDSVVTYDDPNPGLVTGRKVSFGVGSAKQVNPGPIGAFKSVKVGVPNP